MAIDLSFFPNGRIPRQKYNGMKKEHAELTQALKNRWTPVTLREQELEAHAKLTAWLAEVDARGILETDAVIFWGATGQAKVLREMLPPDSRLVAIFDNDHDVEAPFDDVPLSHGWESLLSWRQSNSGDVRFAVAIGRPGMARVDLQRDLRNAGMRPLTMIHPTAFVAGDAILGDGCQILAQAVVAVEAQLGDACIVNTKASVDHECTLGSGVHVGPGATLCGLVTVEDGAFIGAGATVLPRVRIGRGAIVGAGAVVTKNVAAGNTVVGCPAR